MEFFKDDLISFHSIGFPSEWGDQITYSQERVWGVSIQLVSPASGEYQRSTG